MINKKTCIPCQGGIPPLEDKEINNLMQQLEDGWKVFENKDIRKEYIFNKYTDAIIFTKALVGIFVFQIVLGELMVFGEFSPSFQLLHMWGAAISISVIMGLFMIINKQVNQTVNIR